MQRWLSILCVGALGCAGAGHRAPADGGEFARATFERIKALEGKWNARGDIGEQSVATEISYRVTAAGSAVVETLFTGTPHEMVTVYHLDGDRLMLTHYCAAQNQPRMVAQPVEASDVPAVHFAFEGATNLASPNDMHMHEATVWFRGPDRLESAWTAYVGGKPDHTARFELTRAAP